MEINAKRLVENIKTLGRIGYEPEKGTTRPAYSKAYFEGEAYVPLRYNNDKRKKP